MKKDSRHIWYIIDTIVFLSINFYIWQKFEPKLLAAVLDIGWPVILLLATGVYRLTDIITQESVTDFIRAPFMDKQEKDGKVIWEYSERGIRGFFGTLFSCNACMGVWVAMIVFYCFVLFPTPTLAFMIVMALTFFERFFSKIYNYLEKRG